MDINRDTLSALYTGFKKNFQDGLKSADPQYKAIATEVPSKTAAETYPWLGDMPGMREWIGERVLKELGAHDYTIRNRKFELSVRVQRDKIEDDQFGIYGPMFAEMGRSAAIHPDELTFAALTGGFSAECFDGQNFFDADHPVGGSTVSNMQAGSGEPWFLLDVSRALKPLIFQSRKKADKIIRKDKEDDENVFMRDEFIYGVSGRYNVGYGFWQMAFGSKAELTAANFKAARTAMRALKNDEGRPLNIRPNLIVTGPGNEDKARELFEMSRDQNGADNPLKGAVKILVSGHIG
jgi:phage major head subunit gpT-like protein